jgi:hypothetical protein
MKKTITKISFLSALIALGAIVSSSSVQAAATDNKTVTVNAVIPVTMTLACANPTTLTLANVGIPVTQSAACTATTNSETGFNLKAHRVNATNTLTHTDTTTQIIDTGANLLAYTGLVASVSAWTAPTTKGLGFRVKTTGTTLASTITHFGTDATSEMFAAFPTADQTIYNYAAFTAAPAAVNIQYQLDVPPTQKSGNYSGTVVYTATTNP